MKVEFVASNDPHDGRDAYAVLIDEELFMEFCDGEPEDNSMARNFHDVYSLPKLVKKIASATEPVEIIHTQLDWQDYFEKVS